MACPLWPLQVTGKPAGEEGGEEGEGGGGVAMGPNSMPFVPQPDVMMLLLKGYAGEACRYVSRCVLLMRCHGKCTVTMLVLLLPANTQWHVCCLSPELRRYGATLPSLGCASSFQQLSGLLCLLISLESPPSVPLLPPSVPQPCSTTPWTLPPCAAWPSPQTCQTSRRRPLPAAAWAWAQLTRCRCST